MSNTLDETRQEPVRGMSKEVVILEGHRPSETRTDFFSSLGGAVRDQPVSAALITMGVAWLYMGGAKVPLFPSSLPRSSRTDHRLSGPSAHATGEALRQTGSAAVEEAERAGSAIGREASAMGSAMGKGASAASSAVGDGASSAASAASEATSRAFDGLETASHAASDAASSAGTAAYHASRSASYAVRREAEHLQHGLSEFFRRQPWAVGVLGLAVGTGVAVALPKTRTERDWVGESSDAVKDHARNLVSEQVASAQRLAERAFEEAAQEARAQGLSEEKIADAVRTLSDKLTNVATAAGDSLNKEVDEATGAGAKS